MRSGCGATVLKTLEMNARRPALAAFVPPRRPARPKPGPARAPRPARRESVGERRASTEAVYYLMRFSVTVHMVSIFERCSGPSSDHGATLKSICDNRR